MTTETKTRPAVKRTRPRGYIPPKATSSRTKAWRHDATCQLEALPPDVLAEILADEIEDYFDMKRLRADQALEQTERQHIAYALPAPSGNGSHG